MIGNILISMVQLAAWDNRITRFELWAQVMSGSMALLHVDMKVVMLE